jgi:hypothetical protein
MLVSLGVFPCQHRIPTGIRPEPVRSNPHPWAMSTSSWLIVNLWRRSPAFPLPFLTLSLLSRRFCATYFRVMWPTPSPVRPIVLLSSSRKQFIALRSALGYCWESILCLGRPCTPLGRRATENGAAQNSVSMSFLNSGLVFLLRRARWVWQAYLVICNCVAAAGNIIIIITLDVLVTKDVTSYCKYSFLPGTF